MILVDSEIIELAQNGLVSPFNPELVNPASIDIRLGPKLLLDQGGGGPQGAPEHYSPDRWCELTDVYARPQIDPGDFMLAETLEIITLPDNICAQLFLKSSRGRDGYQHILAGWVDPGWHGRLTLELYNPSQVSLPLAPGMKIAQLVLHRCSKTPDRPYSQTGRYHGDMGVQPSKG